MRRKIDDAVPGLLRQANAILSVNKMISVSGERIMLHLDGHDVEMVYYRASSDNAPLIIGYHSGGWLFGGCALNDSMWCAVSSSLDVNIASIGYRKAPRYKWRESLADAYDSAWYLAKHSSTFGFSGEHISLLGPSAGGNMAAAVCIKSLAERDMIFENLILLYPLLDVCTDPEEKGPEYFGGAAAYIMNEQHIPASESTDPLASPAFSQVSDLKGFPRTLCFVAEHDVLRHEGRRFTEMINEAGGRADCIEEPGTSHCYFELGFRDKLTDFEKDFIGPLGVDGFNSGLTRNAAYNTLEIIKQELYKKD